MKHENIQQTLIKICSSAVLEKSPQNIKILEFLVDQALKNKFVKEFSLGIALFGENYNSEESTSKVRVAMYKFRKKLEQYYADEGENDEVIFVVKKGQYNLEFIDKQSCKKDKIRITHPILVAAITGLIVVATILLFTKQKTYSFWDYYFAPKSSNLCFISDQFVVSQKMPQGNFQFITSTRINSEDDFLESQKNINDTTKKAANFSYTSKMAPIAINDLAPWFAKYNSKMTVRLESEFQFNDISEHNLIFIGHFRKYHNAKTIFLSNSRVFMPQKNGFIYCKGNDTILYKNSFIDMDRIDYTMVSFMNLDNNKKALFIASNHDIGVIALCKKLSDKQQLNEFYTHIPDTITYFNALFKVSGIKRTDIGCELVHVEFIP